VANPGDGGFVETSGHKHLDAGGYVDLTASNGNRGTYFLDPTDITIYGDTANGGPAANYVSTDGSINLASSLKLWLDASDTSKVNLTYSSNGITGTVSGTSGTNTLTTTNNNTANLVVGAKIRVSGADGTIALANDTTNTNTYTITAINATTITTAETLTTTYNAGTAFYRGLVSEWVDKSGQTNHATQGTASAMPLWISNGQNGIGVASFDGSNDFLSNTSSTLLRNVSGASLFSVFNRSANTASEMPSLWIAGVGSTRASLGYRNQFLANTGLYAGGRRLAASDSFQAAGTNAYTSSTIIGTGVFDYANATLNVYQSGAGGGSDGTFQTAGNTDSVGGAFYIGSAATVSVFQNGINAENLVYSSALSTNSRNLVEQYQSAKWGIALTPPGTSGAGSSEALNAMASTARAGDTVDGYSVFTTRYLERLSQSANIDLKASNNINLDLKGDTLNIATANTSVTLNAGNQITTASAGTITTNNGAINLTGTNGIIFSNAFALNSGTAATTLTTTNAPITFSNALTLGGNTTLNAGSGTVTFGNTVNGNYNLTATAGTITTNGAWGGSTALRAVSLTSANTSFTLPNLTSTNNVALNAGTGTITTGTITTGAGNLTLTADDLVIGHNLSGTGTLTLKPVTGSRITNINNGTENGSNFNLSTAEINYFSDGWNSIKIGRDY
jgi:hypothetical protein